MLVATGEKEMLEVGEMVINEGELEKDAGWEICGGCEGPMGRVLVMVTEEPPTLTGDPSGCWLNSRITSAGELDRGKMSNGVGLRPIYQSQVCLIAPVFV